MERPAESRSSSRLKRLLFERRRCRFFRYDVQQGQGGEDPDVRVYGSWRDVPEDIRRIVSPHPWRDTVVHRMHRGEARLLCLSFPDRPVVAYGWIQDWRPFRRWFREIASEGTMLGPYWTAPEARGQGLYGRLLAHSLAICNRSRPVLVYTSPENLASQRGLEKAGFHRLGDWELTLLLRQRIRLRRVSPVEGNGE
jgi:GNAT superfamily N-acetyltransferase